MKSGPIETYSCAVDDAWIDLNDHMNAMYYGIVIDRAQEAFTSVIGMGDDYVERTGFGKVVVQASISYEAEVRRGVGLRVDSWLLDVSERGIHVFHELICTDSESRVAVGEQLDLHFDLAQRRTCPLPDDTRQRLVDIARLQCRNGRPSGIGRAIVIPVK